MIWLDFIVVRKNRRVEKRVEIAGNISGSIGQRGKSRESMELYLHDVLCIMIQTRALGAKRKHTSRVIRQ